MPRNLCGRFPISVLEFGSKIGASNEPFSHERNQPTNDVAIHASHYALGAYLTIIFGAVWARAAPQNFGNHSDFKFGIRN